MRMPFEMLMERVIALGPDAGEVTMGELAQLWGEPVSRIADAITAVRVLQGERTYIPVTEQRGSST